MNVFVTMPEGGLRADFFPPALVERLESLATVTWNSTDEPLSEADFSTYLAETDAEVCVTGWTSPQLTESVLESADSLSLIAHTGGSVAGVASEASYDRGVRVVSANDRMAEFVAEQVLGTIVAQLRRLPHLDDAMTRGVWDDGFEIRSLHGARVGLVGLGTIGGYLLEHLRSFDVTVRVYDPYLPEDALAPYDFAERVDLEETLSTADVVSVHASRTPETVGMLDAERLASIPDGALFVNTARADLVVEEALLEELRSGRLEAILDVFHEEPLPEDHELRSLENVLLTPHTGGSRIRPPLTESVLDELERFREGEELEHEVPREQWELMTR